MDESARVQLAEIRGDVKLVLAGQERTNSDMQDLRQTVRGHDGRINVLEADKYQRVGERTGVAISTKLFWTIITAIGAGLLGIVGLVLSQG